jgi:hypothetical protein
MSKGKANDYTPIAMRGGIGDILLYSLKVWGNGFWKYFIISFIFVVILFASVITISLFSQSSYDTTDNVEIEKDKSEKEKEEKTEEKETVEDVELDLSLDTTLLIVIVVSVFVLLFFFSLTFGSNAYISGKLSIGENPSMFDALGNSFKRSGSYLFYSLFLGIFLVGFIISSIYVERINAEFIQLSDVFGSVSEVLKQANNFIWGLLFLLLSPLLLLAYPGMVYMKTNIFKALKGSASLLKYLYGRVLAVIFIGGLVIFISSRFIMINLFSINSIINNEAVKDSTINFGGIIIVFFIVVFLYSFLSSLLSVTFLNVWASKLNLENIYAIKILSSALNNKKIPKNWYRNMPVNRLTEKSKKSKTMKKK